MRREAEITALALAQSRLSIDRARLDLTIWKKKSEEARTGRAQAIARSLNYADRLELALQELDRLGASEFVQSIRGLEAHPPASEQLRFRSDAGSLSS